MKDATPSETALKVAVLRALHQTMDRPRIFVDPLAERILGPGGPARLAAARTTAGETARLRGTLAARGIIAEETVADAATRHIRQAVILGAGLDTFAYRNPHPALSIFELDHPATQTWKRDLLDAAGIDVPPSMRFVPIDFERHDLLSTLATGGFDPAQPAVFVMLGVVPYLARPSLMAILRGIGTACALGSEIVFDYTEPYDDAPDPIRANYRAAADRVAAAGEPWITLLEPEALHLDLRACGFGQVRDLDAAVLHRRFCADRTDGLTIAPLVHLVRARL